MSADPTTRLERLERYVAAHRVVCVSALLLLAAVLRIFTYAELSGEMPMYLHLDAEMDTAFFDSWAHRIADGDIWTDAELHPFHDWHRTVGESVLARHPERVPGFDPSTSGPAEWDAAMRRLWNDWYRGKRFHQEPLYPYLLGVLYAVGGDAFAAYALQPLVGLLGVLLIWALARRYFGDLVGLLAGLLATACGPLMFYDFVLLRTTWIVVAGLALVWMLERLRERPTSGRWFQFGILLGLATALKTTFFPIGIIGAAWVWWVGRAARPQGWLKRAWAAAGVGLALLPFFVRNVVVGAPLFGLTSVGPITFIVSNHPAFLGELGWNVDPRVADVVAETDGGFFGGVFAAIGAHDGLASYIAFLWTKFVRVWHWFEVPNNTNFYHFALFSNTLAGLPVRFGWIAPFGLYGMFVALWRKREGALLALLFATSLATLVAFYHLSRFRAPMLAAMLPFAAFGMLELVNQVARRRWQRAGIASAFILLALAVFHRPIDPPGTPLIRSDLYRATYINAFRPRVLQARLVGRPVVWTNAVGERRVGTATALQQNPEKRAEADPFYAIVIGDDVVPADRVLPEKVWPQDEAHIETVLREFLVMRPGYIDRIDENNLPTTPDQAGTCLIFATVYAELATNADRRGDPDEQQQYTARAKELRDAVRKAMK